MKANHKTQGAVARFTIALTTLALSAVATVSAAEGEAKPGMQPQPGDGGRSVKELQQDLVAQFIKYINMAIPL